MSVAAMARAVVPFVLCLGCLSLVAGGVRAREQQPTPGFLQPRDGAPAPLAFVGTSAIRGVVTSAGQPVADARVMVSGGQPGAPRTAVTDERGRFLVGSLPAGQYTLTVAKGGYVRVSWGQRRYRGNGRPLPLREGETHDVSLELPRAGVITGTVVNERGEPVIGTAVQAIQFEVMSGQRTPRPAGGSSTDDRGLYRIHSLQPGDYIVCANPSNHDAANERGMLRRNLEAMRRGPANPAAVPEAALRQMAERIAQLEAQLAATADEPVRGYAPICVPGPTMGHGGISVGPGEERSAVDLQLERITLASLEGRLVLPAGVSARNIMMTMVRRGDILPFGGGGGSPMLMLEETGRFVRDDVVPGEYRLEARTRTVGPGGMVYSIPAPPSPPAAAAADHGPKLWAAADVIVEAGHTTELTLDLQPAFSISGEVVFEGSSAPPAARMQIVASPVTPPVFRPMLAEQAMGTVDPTGRFVIDGVFPGTYRLSTGLPGWTLKSVMAEDQDVLDFPLEVGGGRPVTGLVVTLTDRAQELSVTLVDNRGVPASEHSLVLFPSDERYWTPMSRRIRIARPDADGTFIYRGVPPGDYRVAAVLDYEPGEWSTPEFLQQLVWTSTRVTVAEGEKKSVSLRVAAGQ
jgi:hypothetical protein